MRAKDPVLRNQVFILRQKLLVHHPVTYANSRPTCVFFIETYHHIPPMFSMDSDCLTIRPHLRARLCTEGTAGPALASHPRRPHHGHFLTKLTDGQRRRATSNGEPPRDH